MHKPHFTQEQLAQVAKLSDNDLKRVNENTEAILRPYLFQQALQIQPTESLFIKATEFLKERRALNPSADIEALFKKYPHAHLQTQIEEVEDLLTSKYSYNLNVVADRFSHMRQLAKPLLEKFTLELAPTGNDSLVKALQIVREILQGTRRSVPGNTNLDFLPKAVRQLLKKMAGSTEKDMKRLSSPRFGITSNVVMWQLQAASGLESLKIFSSALANGKQQTMHSLKKISFRRTQMMCPYTLKIGSIMRLSIFCSGRRTTCLPK